MALREQETLYPAFTTLRLKPTTCDPPRIMCDNEFLHLALLPVCRYSYRIPVPEYLPREFVLYWQTEKNNLVQWFQWQTLTKITQKVCMWLAQSRSVVFEYLIGTLYFPFLPSSTRSDQFQGPVQYFAAYANLRTSLLRNVARHRFIVSTDVSGQHRSHFQGQALQTAWLLKVGQLERRP